MPAASLNLIEIDLAALLANYRNLENFLGNRVRIMAVVKSDAYGHGMLRVAGALATAGAGAFGVAEVSEGRALRQAGIRKKIVVLLGAPPESFTEVVRYDLKPVVFNLDETKDLSLMAERKGTRIGVHLKIDVGMGRLGIPPAEVPGFVQALRNMPGLYLDGILSHFPMADIGSSPETADQNRLFKKTVDSLNGLFKGDPHIHIANSAAALQYPESHFNMVRPGITLYGCYPGPGIDRNRLGLRPVMRFKTRIIQIKHLPPGAGISYGHTFVTDRDTRLAVLPVGYSNGYLRSLSNKAEVLIRGRRVPVRGTVCMNCCLADITDLPDARNGDEVMLLGRQGNEEISAEEIAGWMDTINYEVLCLFGNNNKRIYQGVKPEDGGQPSL